MFGVYYQFFVDLLLDVPLVCINSELVAQPLFLRRLIVLKVMHSLSGVLAQTVARDLLCKDSLIIASSTPQVSHFYIARAYPIINLQALYHLF